jgi:hypothetical protein
MHEVKVEMSKMRKEVGDCSPTPGLHGPGPGSTSGIKSTVCLVFVVTVSFLCFVVGGVSGELGGVITVPVVLERTTSPYFIREELIIDHGAELVIRPGVQLLFSPTVGITVFGRLVAEVELKPLPLYKFIFVVGFWQLNSFHCVVLVH